MTDLKIFISPQFNEEDRGDGGIRRVVEAQNRWLPTMGWEITDHLPSADIVATHAGLYVNVGAQTPWAMHCHGLYWYGFKWERWALKMNRDVIKAMRAADVVTAPSKWVAHAIARGTNLDPPVLYHGVNPDEWEPSAENGGYVLWNKTRVDPICDPTPLWELATRAPTQSFVSTLHWGMPPTENVKAVGITGLKEHRDWIKNAGVYLCTTRETFGIGTIEAMAAGVPILGWDWGGQSEIVTHKETGWLAKPDDYESLMEGLVYCRMNRARMGAAARAHVLENFTWETAIQRYDTLYRSLLNHTGPTVSVVIPAYNMESMLPDTLASVAAQDYNDYEVVIVDDHSTDSTGALADRASAMDPRIRVIHNSENQYLAEALNVGISAARGRYIIPVDADNMLGPGCLAILAQALDKDRSFDIAYGAMSVIEPNGEEWVSGWPTQFEYRRQMKHQNQLTSTSMYRKKIWERVGGYRRRCRTAEDADFWCRATSFGANARRVTDMVVLRYRNRPDSMSHVQQDWAWHVWYPWGKRTELTPWLAPVDEERDDPVIPMHEFALVSVIIPVGPGHERYVLDALDSIRSQTFRWWEAIVVDDTGGRIPWLPSWVRVVRTPHAASGAGVARNCGMAVARGETFIFLDADDYFQPEALELMFVERHRAGGFVYSDWYRHDTGEAHQAPEWDGCDSVLRQLPWPVTCIYPREVWERVGGFDEELPAWEDWDFAIRVVEAGYCGTRLASPLFHYRMDTGRRREAGFSEREALKEQIFKRWSKYITKEKFMPCGCSGGGGLPSLPSFDAYNQAMSPAVPVESNGDAILIEYVGDALAPISYTGMSSGARYRFGPDSDHKVRWVYKVDADHFLNREEFRLYSNVEASPVLAAAGPPR